ncbi:FHA domain-containing protein [Leptolyngbya sp. 7M]|uniref:FHA domain-containing protein n=1 Tax=Leptolyngbya sp. 7M TaxID=2812896 RepID=UPI001CED386C|nr:FHA domain-containing protein [Leptolyngbya sp. 7M]
MRLHYGDNEFEIGDAVVTLGRASDNDVAFPEDPNVSRYHAEIEPRGNEYCLIDLDSSNGTALNGVPVKGEAFLKAGDEILLGGSTKVVFGEALKDASSADNAISEAAIAEGDGPEQIETLGGNDLNIPVPATQKSGSGMMFLIAGAICCVAVLFVAVAAAVYFFRGASCSATARIVNPEFGETIDKPGEIEIDLKDGSCVVQAVYTIDGQPIATSTDPPFTVQLDPKNFPDLADGGDHVLSLVLIDRDGNQLPQQSSVLIAFETRKLTKPEPEPVVVTGQKEPGQIGSKTKELSPIEFQQIVIAFATQIAGGRKYNVSDPQFLQEVRRRTAEYSKGGHFERASKFKDVINVAYVTEQNLDPRIGYFLAMSRSGFDPAKKGSEEGLWRMTNEFVTSNRYNGLCGNEKLSDPSQNCAAKASAIYMKEVVIGIFEGDIIYGIAAFGKSTADAAAWKSTLPQDRTDVWKSIKGTQEREQLVRFFAAGLVAENPDKFGLKNDRPLSELYKLAL